MTLIGNSKSKILGYLLEFFILFASIYIAFELEEWDEDQDFERREEAYLASMHQDLSKDLNQLKRRIQEYDEKILSSYRVLELLHRPYEESRVEILSEFHTQLQYHFNYNPVNNTLETLRTSGDLKLVKNHGFKILLSELDKSYLSTVNQGQIFNNYIEGPEWSGFFINNFDLENMVVFSDNPNLTILFRNKVRNYITLIESYYFHMQGSLKKNEEVKHALEQEMTDRELRFNPDTNNNEQELMSEQEEDSLVYQIDGLLEEIESESETAPTNEEKTSDEESNDAIDQATDDLMDELDLDL